MNKQQKHLTVLVVVVLLLLVGMFGIAVKKGTFDIQGWVRRQSSSSFISSTTAKVLNTVATTSSSTLNTDTEEVAKLSDFMTEYNSIIIQLKNGEITQKQAIIASVERLIALTVKIKDGYDKTFIKDKGASAEAELLAITNSDFLQNNIDRLTVIKGDLEKNIPVDYKVNTANIELLVKDISKVGKDMVVVVKGLKEACGSKEELEDTTKSKEEQLKQAQCLISTIPPFPMLMVVINEAIEATVKSFVDGSEVNYAAIVAAVLPALEEEWGGATAQEFLNEIVKTLEATPVDSVIHQACLDLATDLTTLMNDLAKVKAEAKVIVEPLQVLTTYLYVPWQYNAITGATGQMEVYYVNKSLAQMEILNAALTKGLAEASKLENLPQTIKDAITSVSKQVVAINTSIEALKVKQSLLAKKVNLSVKVVEPTEKQKPIDVINAQLKTMFKKALDEAAASSTAPETTPDENVTPPAEEVPVDNTCATLSNANEAVKVSGCQAVNIYKEIAVYSADYLKIWKAYLVMAKQVAVVAKTVVGTK